MKSSSPFKEENSSMEDPSLDLMTLSLRVLHLTFVIPNSDICSSHYKLILYRCCQFFIHSMYIGVLIAQVVSIFVYWGDLVLVVEAFLVALGIQCSYIPIVYIIWNWEHVKSVVEFLESQSIFTVHIVKSNITFLNILQESRNSIRKLCMLIGISYLTIMFTWNLLPMVLHFVEGYTENEIDLMRNGTYIKWDHFLFVMWVPKSAVEFPMYGVMYGIQVIMFSIMCVYYFTVLNFFLPMIIYSTTQFTVVAAAIKALDVGTETTDRDDALTVNDVNVEDNWECSLYGSTEPIGMNDENEDLLDQDEKPNKYWNDLVTSTNLLPLVECIKLHQSALWFSEQVDSIFSTSFFAWSLILVFVLVGELFQLSLNLGFRKNLQYGSALFSTLTQPFILHWFGERLVTQSLAVGSAAYECHWYKRSTKFKQMILLLLIRAQKPVQLSVGVMANSSLETFAEILNAAYKYFTILLQFHND